MLRGLMLITVGRRRASNCLLDLLIVLIFLVLTLFLGQFFGLSAKCLFEITGIGWGGSESHVPPEEKESSNPSSWAIAERSSSGLRFGGDEKDTTPPSSFPKICYLQELCKHSCHNCSHFHSVCNQAWYFRTISCYHFFY